MSQEKNPNELYSAWADIKIADIQDLVATGHLHEAQSMLRIRMQAVEEALKESLRATSEISDQHMRDNFIHEIEHLKVELNMLQALAQTIDLLLQ